MPYSKPVSGLLRKQVASLTLATNQKTGRRTVVDASVRLQAVDGSDPLHRVSGNWNAVILDADDGAHSIVGRGAGRWPTAESVVADAFEIRRLKSQPVAFAEAC